MALWNPQTLFEGLKQVFSPDTPCAVVYWAGHSDRERIVRGTVSDMGEKLSREKERFMGLLFIGRFMQGRPYESAMKNAQEQMEKRFKDFSVKSAN
jgi:precorrin-4 methylase